MQNVQFQYNCCRTAFEVQKSLIKMIPFILKVLNNN